MDLATVAKLLTTTRTVRRRLDLSRPVTRDVIIADVYGRARARPHRKMIATPMPNTT